MIRENDNILVTTDNWFYAPDGKKYRSAWGKVRIHQDSELLGISTNRNSTNWYMTIGEGDGMIVIAGCQVHYAVKCYNIPNVEEVKEYSYGNGANLTFDRPSEIYIAQTQIS